MDETKNTEQEFSTLKNELNGYKNLFYTGELPVLVINFGLNIVECNLKACEIIGYKREELLGKSIIEFLSNQNDVEPSVKKQLVTMLMQIKVTKSGRIKLGFIHKEKKNIACESVVKWLLFKGKEAVQIFM